MSLNGRPQIVASAQKHNSTVSNTACGLANIRLRGPPARDRALRDRPCGTGCGTVYAANLSQQIWTAQTLVDGQRKGIARPMKCALTEVETTCRFTSM